MDNIQQELNEKESSDRRNSNTEWLLTKCRITKPPPPKPAANPLQFIKVAPCPLLQKAHAQIKKVEEIKVMRHDISEDAEEWQQNLDNWKSSRRKRQEHIIERVVEVKKIEQQEQERARRKSKTFNEMLKERRGHKLNILLYNDNENDLSDYGISSGTSQKSNSIKDGDTDDSSSAIDEKEPTSDSQSNNDISNTSNQSQSEDECAILPNVDKDNNYLNINRKKLKNTDTKLKDSTETSKYFTENNRILDQPQYTYEGAIQDYRSRIKLKINVDDTFLQKQDHFKNKESESSKNIPKVDIFKRKEVFEPEKPVEIQHFESNTSRRLSEDFANSQSIKERLKSLEKCTEQSLKSVDKSATQVNSLKSRIINLNKQNSCDSKNNNSASPASKSTKEKSVTKTISSYLAENSNGQYVASTTSWPKDEISDRCSSPETEIYMNKLNMFNKDLDSFLGKPRSSHDDLDDDCESCTYPPSILSTDLIGLSSDREDSGIHTADVSCSVSQADEPVEDSDLSSTTIPHCIEKLKKEKEKEINGTKKVEVELSQLSKFAENNYHSNESNNTDHDGSDKNTFINVIKQTDDFIKSEQHHASIDSRAEVKPKFEDTKSVSSKILNTPLYHNYENVEIRNLEVSSNNLFCDNHFSLAPPKTMEPPKEKPPPPPPLDSEDDQNFVRSNSTKRIKKELHIKRSSFLGLDEPTDDQLELELSIDRPPDINSFLQKESQLEKSLYRKFRGNRDACEVESQDSGLESERGRLSSDTWCGSYGDLSTPSHDRQDSELTNSVISEEDEITKKEREIIELVEKEEKSRDSNDLTTFTEPATFTYSETTNSIKGHSANYYQPQKINYSDEQDSEVLKVEHELLQLEKEELERRRENIVFRENRTKSYLQNNRHSYENICDSTNIFTQYPENVNYRKSMPNLQNEEKLPADISYYCNSLLDAHLQSHKSMPDIQQMYKKSISEHKKTASEGQADRHVLMNHGKSMPDLQQEKSVISFQLQHNRQPIIAGKPLKLPSKEQRDKGRFMMMNSASFDSSYFQHIKPGRPLTRPGLEGLSAIPKSRPLSNDNWIHPKSSLDSKPKSYDQHWLFQEAELRRLEEQQKNASKRNWPQKRQAKHIPEPIIQTLTHRVQTRNFHGDRGAAGLITTENTGSDFAEHSYISQSHTMGHASPVAYPPPASLEDSQGVMLSVSGKKKCSYCNNELGRGAAMIIESLCLFYHMKCFKCCVCHTQLGDGLMGTDVRVRNQKLHCHNCYSSDDGVKFSCV
ncbi:hypothetical protein FQR65_LT01009 [Abscondita terminalis]|nr:hypothetical protein FQR65_LT01009 [Abscondita terminalis]